VIDCPKAIGYIGALMLWYFLFGLRWFKLRLQKKVNGTIEFKCFPGETILPTIDYQYQKWAIIKVVKKPVPAGGILTTAHHLQPYARSRYMKHALQYLCTKQKKIE
jgi:hypothetical protein